MEKAKYVKWLLHKCADWSSGPQHPCKKVGMHGNLPVILSLGCGDRGSPGASWLDASIDKPGAIEEDYDFHIHIYTCAYTYTYASPHR